MKVTNSQLGIMRHAVGIGQGTPFFRNRFVAGAGHSDMDDLLALVGAGLMDKISPKVSFIGGDDVFFVTDKGRELLMGKDAP